MATCFSFVQPFLFTNVFYDTGIQSREMKGHSSNGHSSNGHTSNGHAANYGETKILSTQFFTASYNSWHPKTHGREGHLALFDRPVGTHKITKVKQCWAQ
jgi:hypothetical protein